MENLDYEMRKLSELESWLNYQKERIELAESVIFPTDKFESLLCVIENLIEAEHSLCNLSGKTGYRVIHNMASSINNLNKQIATPF